MGPSCEERESLKNLYSGQHAFMAAILEADDNSILSDREGLIHLVHVFLGGGGAGFQFTLYMFVLMVGGKVTANSPCTYISGQGRGWLPIQLVYVYVLIGGRGWLPIQLVYVYVWVGEGLACNSACVRVCLGGGGAGLQFTL